MDGASSPHQSDIKLDVLMESSKMNDAMDFLPTSGSVMNGKNVPTKTKADPRTATIREILELSNAK